MYFIATGREPFRSESAFAVINKIICEAPKSARSINAEVPETLDRVISRLLEKNPSDRFQSADELQQLLTEYLAHLQDPERHAQPLVTKTRSERNKVYKRIAFGLAVCGLVIASLLWRAMPSTPLEGNQIGGLEVHHENEGAEHHGHDDSHR